MSPWHFKTYIWRYILAVYLKFYLTPSGILPDIYSGILSGILFDIYATFLSYYIWHIYIWHSLNLTDILSDVYADILSYFIWLIFWQFLWHSMFVFLRCCLCLFSFFSFSPPVRWGLLDFMSALLRLLPPPSSFLLPPPSSFLVLPPSDLSCKLVIANPRQTQTASSGSECSHRTSTASSWSHCSLPDPNSKLRIRAFPAGLNCKRAFLAGPEQQAQDQIVPSAFIFYLLLFFCFHVFHFCSCRSFFHLFSFF